MDKLQKAINKAINTHGKLFCWHDWIFESFGYPSCVSDYIDGRIDNFICTKCGKRKKANYFSEITLYG